MRIPRTEVSTLRRSAKSWGPGADAPTHLPADTEPEVGTHVRPSRPSLTERDVEQAAARAIADLELGTAYSETRKRLGSEPNAAARPSKRFGLAAEQSTTARTSHMQLAAPAGPSQPDPLAVAAPARRPRSDSAPPARGSQPRSDSVITSAPRQARGSSPAVSTQQQSRSSQPHIAQPQQHLAQQIAPQARASQPHIAQAQPEQPHLAQPPIAQPHLAQQQSRSSQSHVAQPHIAQPQPHLAQQQSRSSQPHVAQPHIAQPQQHLAQQIAPQARASQSHIALPLAAPRAESQPSGAQPHLSQPQPRASSPQLEAPQRPSQPPFVAFEGGVSFDPLALPLPPEIAPTIYDWVRRLALQADLTAADKLLRDAVADLTSALSVVIFYKGPDGLYTLGGNDEMPKDQTPIAAVGKARRALVGTHSGFIPICTATDTIAVIQLMRNARQPAFDPVAQITMAAIARESASIMHHLVVKHSMHQAEAEHDKKGLYRPEALESHRNRGQEGVVAELSPGWVKLTYKILVVAILVAAAFAYFTHVPTYSSGVGIVVFEGTPVVSPAAGTVDTIYVQAAASVHKGDALVKLKADKEEADLAQASSELTAAKQQYLIDSSDETLRKTLISAQAAYKRALDALAQKTVHAEVDGTISDIRIRVGAPLEFGASILTIVAPGTEPELWAYLPGSDRPRLRPGQSLQIELTGYQKTRESGTIYDVGRNIIGTAEAKRSLGAEVADALKFAPDGSYVLVKAKLPARTFRARGRTYRYHSGMPAKTEVRVESKRFIVTLLPSLEKYVD